MGFLPLLGKRTVWLILYDTITWVKSFSAVTILKFLISFTTLKIIDVQYHVWGRNIFGFVIFFRLLCLVLRTKAWKALSTCTQVFFSGLKIHIYIFNSVKNRILTFRMLRNNLRPYYYTSHAHSHTPCMFVPGNVTALQRIFGWFVSKKLQAAVFINYCILVLSMSVCVFLNMTLNNILSIVSLYKLKYSEITFTNDATYTDECVCLHHFLPIQT